MPFPTLRRLLFASAAALLALAAPARAEVLTWFAPFGPEAPGATGSGQVVVVVDTTTRLMDIDATWSGLTGITTVAHIHCCTALPGTGAVGIAVTPGTLPGFPAGVSAGSYEATIDLNLAGSFTGGFVSTFGGGTLDGAFAALLAGMDAGRAYFNIHTNLFPGGEIRGFLRRVVPEPATVALLGLALLALALQRRRR